MTGSNSASPASNVPITMPSGTETRIASPKPSSTRCVVAQRSLNSSPDSIIFSSASNTATGVGRNNGLIVPSAFRVTQISSGMTNEATASVHRQRAGIGVRSENSGEAFGLRPYSARQRRPVRSRAAPFLLRFGEPLLVFEAARFGLVGGVRPLSGPPRRVGGAHFTALTYWSSNSPSNFGGAWASPLATMKSAILPAWKLRWAGVTPGVNASRFCCLVKIVVPAS